MNHRETPSSPEPSSESSSSSFAALTLVLSSFDCLQEIIDHLSSRDVTSLDSALCQHRPPLREIFLSSLRNILLGGGDDFFHRGELEWLVSKQIKMQKLRMYASLERNTLLEGDFEYKLRLRNSLKSVDIVSVDDEGAKALLSDPSMFLNNIKDLKISNSQFLTSAGAQKFFNCCTSLRSLQILESRGINDEAFCSLPSLSCSSKSALPIIAPTLQYISINGCNNLTDCGVGYIIGNCKCLLSVDFRNCENITDKSIEIISSCTSITTLILRSCCKITDFSLMNIAVYMKKLTSLNVSFTNITEVGIRELTKKLSTNLIELDFDGCKNVTNRCCETITLCGNLKYLNLNNCNISDDAMISVVQNCRKLELLNAYNCPLTNITLEAIYRNLHNLKNLNLSRCTINHDIEGFGGYEGMERFILVNLPMHLKVLDISKCRTVRDSDLKILSLIKSLESIDISGCRQVTNDGIEVLSSSLRSSLRVLKIAYCRKCTNDSLKSLQTHCLNLSELDISDCPEITDSGLMAISMNLRHLRTIIIFDCMNILSNTADMQAEIRKRSNKNLSIYT